MIRARFLKRAALGVFLVSVLSLPVLADAGVAEGKKIFDSRKCVECHQIKGPAVEKTIKDQLSKKGPELWYAGSKFKKEFIAAWLKDPKPIRPLEYYSLVKKNSGDHVRLDAKAAADVTEYLMGLKSPDAKAVGLQASENPKGRVIFIKRQACYGCHEVDVKGKRAGGLFAPSLVGANARLQTDWIYSYLSNPKAFKPVKAMPVYAGILSDSDMKDLASYVGNLR